VFARFWMDGNGLRLRYVFTFSVTLFLTSASIHVTTGGLSLTTLHRLSVESTAESAFYIHDTSIHFFFPQKG